MIAKGKIKALAPKLALALASTLLTYIAVEVAYRIVTYRSLERELLSQLLPTEPELLQRQNHALTVASMYDPDMGYRYRPNFKVDFPGKDCLSPRRWQTNGHGHVDEDDYPVEKPAGEFRVLVLGDSYTAGVTNSVRWPKVLDSELKRAGHNARVINLARDGMGILHFLAVYRAEGKRFDADVVIVNFILADLLRPLHSRHSPIPSGPSAEARAVEARTLVHDKLAELPWYGVYPEVLAATRPGRKLGLYRRLDLQRLQYGNDTGEDPGLANVDSSLQALRTLKGEHPHVMLLHMPQYNEFPTGPAAEPFVTLRRRLDAEVSDLGIVRMQERLKGFGVNCYQLPLDPHPSDEGLVLYGQAVAELLANDSHCRLRLNEKLPDVPR